LNAVHAKYRHGRPLVSSRAAWVLSLKRGGINREGEAELHSQPPPPPDASDEAWRRLVAPEVLAGKRPDERSDVFVLGGMLFEALTGNSFNSPEGAVKELENSRTTARAAGLGGDYWEVELLAAAVRATREDATSRWSNAKQFADEIVRIAAHRIKSKSALGSIVAGRSSPPEAPEPRSPTAQPPATQAAAKPAATGQSGRTPMQTAQPPATQATAKPAATGQSGRAPMQPAPVPKRSFTPAGLGVAIPPPAPAPATGLAPPLPKSAPSNQPQAKPSAAPAHAAPELSETGRKGTMMGLGVEIPPPPAGHPESSPAPGATATSDDGLRVSATGRKGTMVGLGFEMPPPPSGHEQAVPSSGGAGNEPQLSATGRKGTFAGVGPQLPPPPSNGQGAGTSHAPVNPNQPGRFGTMIGMGPEIPSDRPTPNPAVSADQPGRSRTVQGLGPDSEIPIPKPAFEETGSDLAFELSQPKPKRRLGKFLAAAVVFLAVPLLVLRFGFRDQYEALRAQSLRAVGGFETNVHGVEPEAELPPKPTHTTPKPLEPEVAADDVTGTTGTEEQLPGGSEAQPGDPATVDAQDGAASVGEEAETVDPKLAEPTSAAPAPAKQARPRPKQKRGKPKPKALKTPDYGI
jgi:hypothetical protein